MQAGSIIEQMVFDSRAMGKSFMGNLKPGEGKVYTAELAKAQFMRLNLQANSKVLLSVYSPAVRLKYSKTQAIALVRQSARKRLL
jgi:serine/threonine-protein kinase